VAGGLCVVDPLLVHNTALRMTETLAALLVAGAVWMLARAPRRHSFRHGLGLGLIVGLGMLCRPSLAVLGLAILVVAAIGRSARSDLGWRLVLGSVAGVAVCEIPWVLRNTWSLGHPVPATTHGGQTLHRGNNPHFYRDAVSRPYDTLWPTDSVRRWQAEMDAQAAGLSEIQRDRLEYRAAWAFISTRPHAFLACSWRKFRRFWATSPNPVQAGTWARMLVGIVYIVQIPLWIIGACLGPAPRWFRTVLVIAVLSLGLTHALYWSNMRMRTPVVPALSVLAGLGVAALVDARKKTQIPC